MRKLTMMAAAMLSTAMVTPAFADGHLRITDEPVELTVHLHNKRYFYDSEWPVEQAARCLRPDHVSEPGVRTWVCGSPEETLT